MPIKIVPMTSDSDAKRRKGTISRFKGTPSERAMDNKAFMAKQKRKVTDPGYKGGIKIVPLTAKEEQFLKRNDGGNARKTRIF